MIIQAVPTSRSEQAETEAEIRRRYASDDEWECVYPAFRGIPTDHIPTLKASTGLGAEYFELLRQISISYGRDRPTAVVDLGAGVRACTVGAITPPCYSVRQSPRGRQVCAASDYRAGLACYDTRGPGIFSCACLGLIEMCVPIKRVKGDQETVVAVLLAGQYRVAWETYLGVKQLQKRLGIEKSLAGSICKGYKDVPLLDQDLASFEHRLRAVSSLVYENTHGQCLITDEDIADFKRLAAREAGVEESVAGFVARLADRGADTPEKLSELSGAGYVRPQELGQRPIMSLWQWSNRTATARVGVRVPEKSYAIESWAVPVSRMWKRSVDPDVWRRKPVVVLSEYARFLTGNGHNGFEKPYDVYSQSDGALPEDSWRAECTIRALRSRIHQASPSLMMGGALCADRSGNGAGMPLDVVLAELPCTTSDFQEKQDFCRSWFPEHSALVPLSQDVRNPPRRLVSLGRMLDDLSMQCEGGTELPNDVFAEFLNSSRFKAGLEGVTQGNMHRCLTTMKKGVLYLPNVAVDQDVIHAFHAFRECVQWLAYFPHDVMDEAAVTGLFARFWDGFLSPPLKRAWGGTASVGPIFFDDWLFPYFSPIAIRAGRNKGVAVG
jgi:ligand-binding sensor protein